MPLKSLTKFITTALTKYKRQRVAAVVDSYIKATENHITRIAPLGLSLYRDVAQTVIDKTYENPEPLLQFVKAVDGLNKHYGEAVATTVKARIDAINAEVASSADGPEFTAVFSAIADMCSDTNPEPAPSIH